MKIILLTFLLVLNLFSSTEYEDAYAIYKQGDFKRSLELFKTLANKHNDYDAAYILAFMYEHGEGTKIDLEESRKWYKFSSHGYYWQIKPNPNRSTQKESLKIFEGFNKSEDNETEETIKQLAQGLFNIQAYKPMYFLPISYRFGDSYPTTNGHEAKQIETEFQISFKYDFAPNLLGFNEIYSIGYTQLSFWQLYEKSAYFRETNYNPELFVTLPVKTEYLKAMRFSFEHQSNGRGGEEERSWNFLSSRFYVQTGWLVTELKLWYRLEDATDYNPDLLDYMGYGHIKFMVPYKKNFFTLMHRNSFSGKSATEINYTYPAFGLNDLFFFVKGFNGYGESLIDYNNHVNKLSIGFSITR